MARQRSEPRTGGAPRASAAAEVPRCLADPGRPAPVRRPTRATALMRTVALTAVATGIAYLVWRATATMNPEAPLLSWTMWGLEAYAVAGLALFTFALWDCPEIPPVADGLPAGRTAVLVTTYDEPLEILLPVVIGALGIRTPHETWVLDGGARPEVEELARRLGADYLARQDTRGAKAGTLNHALGLVRADFVAVFDADHVPHPDFLVRTLPYLNDPAVALVQTPQAFYNQDSFEHLRRRRGRREPASEQSLFYRVIQPAKDRWRSAFWCGTGAVLRTVALRDIGGVATGSVTEDFQTTIRLHRAGWRSVYHNHVLARGLAAHTANDYLLQRRRWCIGAMQTWRQEAPLTDRALSWPQRLSYATTMLAWFDPLRTLGLFLLPPIVLLTGQAPIRASLSVFVAVFAVVFTLQQSALLVLGRGRHRPIASTVFELIRLEAVVGALAIAASGRQASFHVTPKGRSAGVDRRPEVPHLLVALGALYVAAFVPYVASLVGLADIAYPVPGVAHGAALWAVAGGLLLASAIHRIRSPRHAPDHRRSYRHAAFLPAEIGRAAATVTDLSMTGMRVELPEEDLHRVLGDGEIHVTLPLDDGVATLVGIVVAARASGLGTAAVGVDLAPGQGPTVARLMQGLFHRI